MRHYQIAQIVNYTWQEGSVLELFPINTLSTNDHISVCEKSYFSEKSHYIDMMNKYYYYSYSPKVTDQT